jgi:hypothetical protein
MDKQRRVYLTLTTVLLVFVGVVIWKRMQKSPSPVGVWQLYFDPNRLPREGPFKGGTPNRPPLTLTYSFWPDGTLSATGRFIQRPGVTWADEAFTGVWRQKGDAVVCDRDDFPPSPLTYYIDPKGIRMVATAPDQQFVMTRIGDLPTTPPATSTP